MEPTEKSPEMDNIINTLISKDRKETIKTNKCTICNNIAESFEDELSRKEYQISGMCQQCQNGIDWSAFELNLKSN